MTPLIIVLGIAGSGRSAVVKELADNAWVEGKAVRILLESAETSETATRAERWTFKEGEARVPQPAEEAACILITNGRLSAVDQMEAIHHRVTNSTWQIQRVVTVIDCALAHRHPELSEWYEACIHFSDAVVLNRRWEVPGQWMSKFLEKYENSFYPCLFFNFLKEGRLHNPAAVIEGDPLRMSHIFDEIDAVDEMEFDEDNLPDEPFDLVRQPDKYFARDELGRRMITVPDIKEVLKLEGR
jgi:hypothetical protein